MAYTTINKSKDNFNTVLYTGNETNPKTITGFGFQPDFTWIKTRDTSGKPHMLFDVVRGVYKNVRSDTDIAEDTNNETLTAFGTDGFTLGNNGKTNLNGAAHVAWNWRAGNAQGSSNTDGSINTTYTSVNTTAGFSISQYTGNGSAGATVGHGLGAVPGLILIKNLSSASTDWGVYHKSLGGTKALFLDLTAQADTNIKYFNNTDPTNQVFSLGTYNDENANGENYIAYCFAEKTGYSSFGSYVGNGASDGSFIYLGFKPAFFMCKRTDSANNWTMYDNKRNNAFNEVTHTLIANAADTEATSTSDDDCDFLSNGVKMRCSNNGSNGSNANYVYMAFAEAPLVGTNNIPCTAR